VYLKLDWFFQLFQSNEHPTHQLMACYKTSYYNVTCHHFIHHGHEINDSSYILTIKDLINMLKKTFPLKIKPTHACHVYAYNKIWNLLFKFVYQIVCCNVMLKNWLHACQHFTCVLVNIIKRWIFKYNQNESWILLFTLGQLEHSRNKVKQLNV
jgi:hypothetical protein